MSADKTTKFVISGHYITLLKINAQSIADACIVCIYEVNTCRYLNKYTHCEKKYAFD